MAYEIGYYDQRGQPITQEEWLRGFEDLEGRIVARTEGTVTDRTAHNMPIEYDVTVSTVWLGLDHSFGHGAPLIFETLIMGGPHDGEMWRYPTRRAAEAGHKRAVRQAGLTP